MWLYHFTFLPAESSCSTFLSALGMLSLFHVCHSSGNIVAHHFGLVSLMANDVDHLFMCFLSVSESYFVKCLFTSLINFLTKLFVLLFTFRLQEFFIYSEYSSFVWCMCCKCFLPVYGLPFCFLKEITFHFDEAQFTVLSLF